MKKIVLLISLLVSVFLLQACQKTDIQDNSKLQESVDKIKAKLQESLSADKSDADKTPSDEEQKDEHSSDKK